jgi:nucleoporin GLE1
MEAAFPLAAVAIGVWSRCPEVGELLLAHFHSMCPCLVPLYIQKTSDMTEVDYMK